jgi:imidazoleglycerol-phosphate dehydratase / histidinol-phosphatase
MVKYLFIDRDGTIIQSPPSPAQIDTIEELIFLPDAIEYLGKIAKELTFKFVMVTNQNGLGTAQYSLESFHEIQDHMLAILSNAEIIFDDIIIDDSYPHENSDLRKPRIGRMHGYLNDTNNDIKNSFVIGDRLTDVQFAKNLGCKAIFVNPENLRGASELTDSIEELKTNHVALATTHWKDVYEFLKTQNNIDN